jgi:hypothetical protein
VQEIDAAFLLRLILMATGSIVIPSEKFQKALDTVTDDDQQAAMSFDTQLDCVVIKLTGANE